MTRGGTALRLGSGVGVVTGLNGVDKWRIITQTRKWGGGGNGVGYKLNFALTRRWGDGDSGNGIKWGCQEVKQHLD